MPGSERGGLADVVYVICLMQASFLVLAGFGEVLLMGGNGAYLIAPLIKGGGARCGSPRRSSASAGGR